jgi:hypothetical protein
MKQKIVIGVATWKIGPIVNSFSVPQNVLLLPSPASLLQGFDGSMVRMLTSLRNSSIGMFCAK